MQYQIAKGNHIILEVDSLIRSIIHAIQGFRRDTGIAKVGLRSNGAR